MVIRSGSTKVALVLVAYVTVFMASFLGSVLVGEGVGYAVAAILQLIAVLLLVRHFRGDNESDDPRPLWRMTAYPTLGFVLAAMWAVQGLSLFMAPTDSVGWIQYGAALTIVALAVLFANSSFRLFSSRRHSES